MSVVAKLFSSCVIAPRTVNGKTNEEIIIPAVPQFTALVAEEFLTLYGPRRLISFVQRCEGSGPWKETVDVTREIGGVLKNVKYSKLELELVSLQKRKMANLFFNAVHEKRINELLIATSFSDKSDDELLSMARKWISGLWMDRSLPEPIPEQHLDEYEKSFKPLKRSIE